MAAAGKSLVTSHILMHRLTYSPLFLFTFHIVFCGVNKNGACSVTCKPRSLSIPPGHLPPGYIFFIF